MLISKLLLLEYCFSIRPDCTTTELSKLLTSCLTAVKNMLSRSIKKSGEIFDNFKARDFNATSLSTYDFSTLYTTLPHNLIKDKLFDLI